MRQTLHGCSMAPCAEFAVLYVEVDKFRNVLFTFDALDQRSNARVIVRSYRDKSG